MQRLYATCERCWNVQSGGDGTEDVSKCNEISWACPRKRKNLIYGLRSVIGSANVRVYYAPNRVRPLQTASPAQRRHHFWLRQAIRTIWPHKARILSFKIYCKEIAAYVCRPSDCHYLASSKPIWAHLIRYNVCVCVYIGTWDIRANMCAQDKLNATIAVDNESRYKRTGGKETTWQTK